MVPNLIMDRLQRFSVPRVTKEPVEKYYVRILILRMKTLSIASIDQERSKIKFITIVLIINTHWGLMDFFQPLNSMKNFNT